MNDDRLGVELASAEAYHAFVRPAAAHHEGLDRSQGRAEDEQQVFCMRGAR